MAKKEIVTARLLEREFNSDRFLSGLEECIEITSKKGYETGFAIHKKIVWKENYLPVFYRHW